MHDEEPSCLLRRLTLCDGQEAVQLGPRAHQRTKCYCEALAAAIDGGWPAIASAVRTERARVIAQSDELRRVRERHDRWTRPADW